MDTLMKMIEMLWIFKWHIIALTGIIVMAVTWVNAQDN